jgi:hypothetical protein
MLRVHGRADGGKLKAETDIKGIDRQRRRQKPETARRLAEDGNRQSGRRKSTEVGRLTCSGQMLPKVGRLEAPE